MTNQISNQHQDKPKYLVPIVGFGLLCMAFSPILVRLASAGGASGLAVASWRTIISVAVLLPFAIFRLPAELKKIPLKTFGLIVFAGIFLGLHFVSWISSLYYTSVASASVLVTIHPIFLGFFGWLLLKEKVTNRTIVAIVLALIGSAIIAYADQEQGVFPSALLGNSLALLGAFLVTFYLLIGRRSRQGIGWLAYVFPVYFMAMLTVVLATFSSGVPLTGYDNSFYFWTALLAIGPQIIGHGSFNYAVRYVPAAKLGLLTATEPVFASVVAFFLFDELPVMLAFIGMLIVLMSVGLALRIEKE